MVKNNTGWSVSDIATYCSDLTHRLMRSSEMNCLGATPCCSRHSKYSTRTDCSLGTATPSWLQEEKTLVKMSAWSNTTAGGTLVGKAGLEPLGVGEETEKEVLVERVLVLLVEEEEPDSAMVATMFWCKL